MLLEPPPSIHSYYIKPPSKVQSKAGSPYSKPVNRSNSYSVGTSNSFC